MRIIKFPSSFRIRIRSRARTVLIEYISKYIHSAYICGISAPIRGKYFCTLINFSIQEGFSKFKQIGFGVFNKLNFHINSLKP